MQRLALAASGALLGYQQAGLGIRGLPAAPNWGTSTQSLAHRAVRFSRQPGTVLEHGCPGGRRNYQARRLIRSRHAGAAMQQNGAVMQQEGAAVQQEGCSPY